MGYFPEDKKKDQYYNNIFVTLSSFLPLQNAVNIKDHIAIYVGEIHLDLILSRKNFKLLLNFSINLSTLKKIKTDQI